MLSTVCQLSLCKVRYLIFYRSSLNLLNLLVRLKIPGISASLVTQNMDQVLEILSSTTFGSIRVAALQFLEACMYIFPKGITYKLQEIRDVAR